MSKNPDIAADRARNQGVFGDNEDRRQRPQELRFIMVGPDQVLQQWQFSELDDRWGWYDVPLVT
jgi:hypothetical protein